MPVILFLIDAFAQMRKGVFMTRTGIEPMLQP